MSIQSIRRRFAGALLVGVALLALTPAAFAQTEGRKVKSKVTPVYPELAKRMNVSGAVKVQVTITAAGLIKSTKVVGGHPLLVESALEALKKWRFEPASGETTQLVVFNFDRNQ